jgi:hypothetical protein
MGTIKRWFWLAMAAALLLVVTGARPSSATLNREFALRRVSDLLAGEQAGVGVTMDGALIPGPAMHGYLTGEVAYVWALAPDGHGGAYAGTGSDGRVYQISKDGVSQVIGETLEYELFSLVTAPDGSLYFAGAPNGTVLHQRPGGDVATVVDLPHATVWDLLLSPRGALFVSSGDTGDLYRVDQDGRTQPAARVPDTHVVSLAWWRDRLLCGTDGRGLLVAFDPESGRQEVLYDTPQEEIVALLPLGDRVVFAANGAEAPPVEAAEVGDTALPVIDVSKLEDGRQACLFELRANGLVRQVWRTTEKQIHSLALAPDGSILVGTGDQGLLYALDARWEATRLVDVDEADVLSLAVDGQRVFVGTGNSGAVYFLDWDRRREGSYTSKVLDAEVTAQWGTPHWVAAGQGRITFATRSGQTREADETWSDWQELVAGRVASPTARFLQWRARLSAEAASDFRITDVTIPYRGPNQPPVIHLLTVSPEAPMMTDVSGGSTGPLRQELPGGVRIEYSLPTEDADDSVPRAGIWTRTLRSAAWIADDPDGDELRYDLHLGFMGEDTFYPLKLDLKDPAWTWDAAAWPDGWYRLRVIASDAKANVAGSELTGEAVSSPFQIDNTPPRFIDLRIQTGETLLLTGVAEDDASRISALEISVDGEGWRPALPSDGIFDSAHEEFAIPVPRLPDGRRPTVLGVRAADEVGHITTARLRITS